MLTPDSDYRDVIRREYEKRCGSVGRYSLTAYARDLGLAPSRLSEILSGKQGLSKDIAVRIAGSVGLDHHQRDLFCDLVEAEHGRSQEKRVLAKIRLQERSDSWEYLSLQEETFTAMSDWYHFAILQLLQAELCAPRAKDISECLGITATEAQDALTRLVKLGVLTMLAGKLKPTREFIATSDNVPSEAIRNFHRQILNKAQESIDHQSVDKRNLSANLFPINKSDIPKAKEMLKRFRRRFARDLSSTKSPNAIYCLTMQLFELTKDRP